MHRFLLARPDRTLCASGARARYPDSNAAAAALRDGAPLIVGALPFDVSQPAALTAPREWAFHDGPWQPLPPKLPAVRIAAEIPSPTEHIARVATLVKMIEAGELDKVVAARALRLTADAPIDPEALAAGLALRHPRANCFVVDLNGPALVGASPELLVGRYGRDVRLRPLAGTAPRRADPQDDRAEGEALLASSKNRQEHAYVIDWIADRLAPICRELTIPDGPELICTPQVWHLATPIRAVLRDPATTALDLAALLHPTPAVGGAPAEAAMRAITDIEGDRRFYGGAVGWCDSSGDGEWIVAIRCAEISADGSTALAWAGGGIVAASDPQSELDETTTKFGTLLGAFEAIPDPTRPVVERSK